ncbi:hypothetical protein [Lacibacter sp. H407]|uniref:hypothetical protein n=1 Tax=Lacibacter sp. H407 TaxID=3133423 RepID=UPI0030C320F8
MKRNGTVQLQFLFPVIIGLAFVACKKQNLQQPPPVTGPEMEYIELNNREIKANMPSVNLDINQDGKTDIAFATVLVGDNLNQVDKLQFLVATNISVNLPVNGNEEIPVLKKGESIMPGNFNGYQWFELAGIVLIQKVISFTQPPVWEGHWKNAVRNYLPFQILANEKRYNGWIELSVDLPAEKIILHKAAISKEANRIVKAGE